MVLVDISPFRQPLGSVASLEVGLDLHRSELIYGNQSLQMHELLPKKSYSPTFSTDITVFSVNSAHAEASGTKSVWWRRMHFSSRLLPLGSNSGL